MGTTTYTTVAGQILHENRNGVETELVPDPLGSVIQTRNSAGNTVSSTVYWPYGEVRTETGTNPTPWGFVGTYGYYRDSAESTYVRARYYRPSLTRWQTVDPLWPDESAYGYAGGMPTMRIDPSGLAVFLLPIGGAIAAEILRRLAAAAAAAAALAALQARLKYCRENPGACSVTIPLPRGLPRLWPEPNPTCDAYPVGLRPKSTPSEASRPIPIADVRDIPKGRGYRNCKSFGDGCKAQKKLRPPGVHGWQWDKYCNECAGKCRNGSFLRAVADGCAFWKAIEQGTMYYG
ncbi:MAG: RHS repeat-associated core domain-containing protein [Alphaproteobacteria bacterium]|nr:MAG: RHS repeat-associated core domain-containing protein [Alphaproteobacteria bacterium]